MSPSSHVTPSVANRKIREPCILRRATRYGGFNLLSDFVRAQGIARAFAEAFGRDKVPWATDSWPERLRHVLDGYLLGLEWIWHFEELEPESLLCLKRGPERGRPSAMSAPIRSWGWCRGWSRRARRAGRSR
jgi:hypothetical protein